MNLRKFRRTDPDVNLTPLIDVVFLLLIFFMVSTTFNRQAEISINLPKASTEQAEAKEDPLTISIDARGRYYVNNREVINTQPSTLKRAVREAAGDRKNPPLIVSADANTPHQAVVTAMDVVRQLGFTHLSIATQTQRDTP